MAPPAPSARPGNPTEFSQSDRPGRGPEPRYPDGTSTTLVAIPQRPGDPGRPGLSPALPVRLGISNLLDLLHRSPRAGSNLIVRYSGIPHSISTTTSRARQSQTIWPRLSTLCQFSKFFNCDSTADLYFRRFLSRYSFALRRHPRDCVGASPLKRERDPSLSSRKLRTRAHLLCLQSGDTCCFFADIIKQSSPPP